MADIPDTNIDIFEFSPADFSNLALKVFNFQYAANPVYRQYCDLIRFTPAPLMKIHEIPYLPVQFFKTQKIKTTLFDEEVVFQSSGSTGAINSHHFVKDTSIYETSFTRNFESVYGSVKDLSVIGLLPSYLERSGSSLVYMVEHLIRKSENKNSGFYLYDHVKLKNVLLENEKNNQKTILIGVTYALLDFGEKNPMALSNTIIMETGGMKGRKKEITRDEVHDVLKKQFSLSAIHSEYGMTELLSQAYAVKNGMFKTPPWMKVLVRAEDDPLHVRTAIDITSPLTGVCNVIDLANIYSCSFIATDDITRLHPDGSFEILGRLDNSDIRGCGLMVQ